MWAIELIKCYLVRTTYKDQIIIIFVGQNISEWVKKCETRKGGISGKKSDSKEEKAKSKAKVAMKVLVLVLVYTLP